MSPQLPEPVLSTLQALAKELLSVLGDRLVGVYLGGSAATGDFCATSSDLDFLVVTEGHLSMEDLLAIQLIHRDLLKQYPYAARLEGDYVPRDCLTSEGATMPVPGCEGGVFLPRVGEVMLTADSIWEMREHGIAIYGPDPREVLPEVSPEQVRAAVRCHLAQRPDICETPKEMAAELLNLVRYVCALEQGRPVSKTAGAKWGMVHLNPAWRASIQAALAVRAGSATAAHTSLLRQALPHLERELRGICCAS